MKKYSLQNSMSGNAVSLLWVTKKSFKNYKVYPDAIHDTIKSMHEHRRKSIFSVGQDLYGKIFTGMRFSF